MMLKQEIKERVYRCLKRVKDNEKDIIQNDISERAITHKLAEYLQIEFQRYHVDVEYNRNYEAGQYEPKKALIIKEGFDAAFTKAKRSGEDFSDFINQVTTYPDIVIHKRMTNSENTLIIEIKKSNNRSDWDIDQKKLEAFTRKKTDEGYGYVLGLHLIFYINECWKEPKLNWYENGEPEKT
ncbi:MAG: hypothetical protein LLG04_18145 [Parachlamydia sp.]|nr:hypothetical protein [Parachlamydia sp.]